MKKKELTDEEKFLLLASDDPDTEKKELPGESAEMSDDNGIENGKENEKAPKEAPDEGLLSDIAELRELFPGLTAESIPDAVWDRVRLGESLAASYALYFIKCVKEKERLNEHEREVAKKAPPRVKSNPDGKLYFSPEAVKSMSEAEVRKNYDAIIASMSKWK